MSSANECVLYDMLFVCIMFRRRTKSMKIISDRSLSYFHNLKISYYAETTRYKKGEFFQYFSRK